MFFVSSDSAFGGGLSELLAGWLSPSRKTVVRRFVGEKRLQMKAAKIAARLSVEV